MTALPMRRLGRTDVRVTAIGFGGAPLGNLFSPVSDEESSRTVAQAWEAGIRYFDTAPLYGHGLSETRVGRGLAAYPRDAYVLSTKVGRRLERREPDQPGEGAYIDVPPWAPVFDYSADGVLRSVESSLARLGLARIDILLVHDIDAFTHGTSQQPARFREAMSGAYPALDRLRREGTVRAIGVGVNEWEVCLRCAEEADFDCFLLAGRYSLLEQTALESFLPLCARRGIGVVIGGPFNSGILATGPIPGATYNYRPAPPAILDRARRLEEVCQAHGVPLAAAALQFPLGHPAVSAVIFGARSAAEVRRDLELFRHPIPAALWSDLRATGLLREDAPTPEAPAV
jgi:D-threo-aldose 1-dehydrogenase